MKKFVLCLLTALPLIGCGGGGGSTAGGQQGGSVGTGSPAATYGVSGNVSGATGSLTLQLNSANDLSVAGPGSFNFSSQLQSGVAFTVGVLSPPPGQVCTITNGSGVISSASASDISINCVTRPHFLYQQNFATIAVNNVNPITAGLTIVSGSPFSCTTCSSPATIDTKARFTFLSSNSGYIHAYVNDPITGTINSNETGYYAYQGSNVYSLAMTPSGDYLYSLNGNSYYPYGITAFKVNKYNGALTTVSGSPFTPANNGGNNSPSTMIVDPSGKFLLLALNTTSSFTGYPMAGVLVAFSIDQLSGSLTLVSNASIGMQPTHISAHPNGRFVYVESIGDMIHQSVNGGIDTIVIDNKSGSIVNQSYLSISSFAYYNTGPIAIDPSGRFAYTSSYNTINVLGFDINQSTGALTSLAGSPFSVGGGTSAGPVAIDLSGSRLYVTGSNGIYLHSIDANTGALTVLPSNPIVSSTGTSLILR